MSIRQPAAEKLVRQLLELRLTRVNALSDAFVAAMAKIVRVHVDMDETQQQREAFDERYNAALERNSTKE